VFTRTSTGPTGSAATWNVAAIRGAPSLESHQAQRQHALDGFKKGTYGLVATDIVARGIDVDSISHVIKLRPSHAAAGTTCTA